MNGVKLFSVCIHLYTIAPGKQELSINQREKRKKEKEKKKVAVIAERGLGFLWKT